MRVYGWKLEVSKEMVRIFDEDDKITDAEAVNIIKYLYDEGLVISDRVECVIISK